MNPQDTIKTIIVGAGKAGELLARDIKRNKDSNIELVGFVDDDRSKFNHKVAKLKVLGSIVDLPDIVSKFSIEEIIIAIPSERGEVIRKIIDATVGLRLHYKILPRISEILLQNYKEDYLKHVRRVTVQDILGGEIEKDDQTGIAKFVKNKTVLITGAAGSIGSELSRQIVAYKAKNVILYDWWENGMFALRNYLLENYPDVTPTFVIGDVKDRHKMDYLMQHHHPDIVIHAAAYKHVPLMEDNSAEAVKNNIIGTRTVAEMAIKNKVNKFLLVSTDKAVNPTNIMGASKRAAEKVIHILSQSQTVTSFCTVRFGNVINSNGSVLPIFKKQISKGGPVTVTHKDITRFFMTISEAVHLILKSLVMSNNNDLFVLDMGESIKIYDLARTVITLSGYIPDEEIKIKIVGLRPGEKLYEEVLVKEEEVKATAVKKVFRTKNCIKFDKMAFLLNLNLLCDEVIENDINFSQIREHMKALVSTYRPTK